MIFTPSPLWRGALALVAVSTALLSGCAAPGASAPGDHSAAPASVAAANAAPLIHVPPTSVGTWVDLGHVLAPWLAGDAQVPVTGPTAPTRIAGLQRDDGRWLAIVIAQVAPNGHAPCPPLGDLHVGDVGNKSDGCLRARRDADFDRWLQQQHAVLYQWLDGRGWTARPRAWVGYRVPAATGGALEVHALVDPTLIEPTTRTNTDFLAGGQPGLQWARELAAAARVAGGGALTVPPFPFAPQLAPPAPAPAPAVATPPARAEQVPAPPPPVPAPPRRDRE